MNIFQHFQNYVPGFTLITVPINYSKGLLSFTSGPEEVLRRERLYHKDPSVTFIR